MDQEVPYIIKKEDLLFVYDIRLHKRIVRTTGPKPLTTALSMRDNQFWLYQRLPSIEKVITEFSR
ncbi:hypothetical protein [Bacillus infantis]|uniref:hypothetical protein n=1 Tax=Bacillus infantis TaxID=324767 RepID=UPI003CF517EB